MPNAGAPECHGVLEACLYADDLDAAAAFYTEVLGLQPFATEAGRHVFFRTGGETVFLLFNSERTREPHDDARDGTPVPPHGSRGAGHVAFTIAEGDIDAWRERFAQKGVGIESELSWPRGGRSL